ncbi:dual specificity protein phosphatase family protein [Hoeflea sp.]|uniref:dual specificity protein phosphatase family protein n=1 Tax=Hoeflea sp. TaxID=1940281 RepID=UPI003B51C2FE
MKKILAKLIVVGFVLLLAGGGFLGAQRLSGNFHTVVSGQLYRSAQVTPERLAAYKQKYGIKSVINLRGSQEGASWYDNEVSSSEKLGIEHFDFRMSASHRLSKARATELIQLMENAPKPLLIHCKAGADRSGLVSALYKAAIAKYGEESAEDEISILFGHFGIPYLSSTYAMDETWEDFEPWLGFGES